MLAADYWPQLIAGTEPAGYSENGVEASGWLVPMLLTGVAEETLFRGLLTGYLSTKIRKRYSIGGTSLPAAAVVVAVIFAGLHWKSFLTDPLHAALAQQLYAFAWALIYTWLMERSKSLLAPIVAHGIGNGVEVGLVICWKALS